MSSMNYKGYSARIEFDAEDRLFVGHLAGVRDIVGFHGTSVSALEAAFHAAVDDYLAACKKLGQEPNKPFSGRVMLRVPPQVHARASARATVQGVRFSQWATKVLERAAH